MSIELIILAGGNSKRFGRYKQIEPVTKKQESLIELSIKGAINAGINRAIIVIKSEIIEVLKSSLTKYSKYIKIVYVIQGEDMLKNRQLYGVGYALWISSKLINNNFLVINGDDYYSSNSIEIATKALSNCNVENNHFMLGYKLKNTLFEESNNINRGICKISDNKILFIDIATRIKIKNNITTGYLKSISKQFSGDEITCMNFYGFKKNILDELDKHVNNQLNLNNEITIHDMINLLISENKIILTSINLEDKCLGLTNIDDLEKLKKHITKCP